MTLESLALTAIRYGDTVIYPSIGKWGNSLLSSRIAGVKGP
jgi:hypothetical protein